MAQASITSFFGQKRSSSQSATPAKKHKNEPKLPDDQKCQEKEESSQPAPSKPLKSPFVGSIRDFSRGKPADPDFYNSTPNQKRHEQFMAKIGKPKRGRYASDVQQARRLKPFDEQYIEIKRQYPDTILIVEVGYKYKILSRDAQIAARQFGWALMPGWLNIDEGDPVDALYDRFASCSFPVARLHFYIQKLINAGHKVGVVGQLETSALKSVGDNRRGPFKREVTAIYTRGTYIAESDFVIKSEKDSLSGHISAIATDPQTRMTAFVSVQPTTGEIIWDLFEDTDMAIELETRIMHVQPCEVLLLKPVTTITKKLAGAIAQKGPSVRISENARCDTLEFEKILGPYASSGMGELLNTKSEPLCQAAVLLVKHLTGFDLSAVFAMEQNYSHFSSKSRMLLNGNALAALEIFQNNTDHTPRGSLFSVMDQTETDFGRRLLKKWIAQPLLNREMLQTRIFATEELISNFCEPIARIHKLLSRLPDLEKVLAQIQYGRISPKQLVNGLQSFGKVANSYTQTELTAANLKSTLLTDYFEALLKIRDKVEGWLSQLNSSTAQSGSLEDLFVADDGWSQSEGAAADEIASVFSHKLILAELQEEFESHRAEMQKLLGVPVKLVDNLGESNLLEVSQKDLKSVPADWQKQSGTKQVARYRSPQTMRLVREENLAKETLQLAARAAFDAFVKDIREHSVALRDVVVALANIDCLMSLARLSSKPGYTTVNFVDEPCIDVEQGRHPMIDELIMGDYIPNDIRMLQSDNRVLVITGPNMGGKSSFSRQIALICLMAQVGSAVPASRARLSLVDAIYTRMGAYDNIMRGESSFQVELKECSDILARTTSRSLVILDEVGRGTSTTDGMAIAHAVLDYTVSTIGCFCLFITHYSLLTEIAAAYPKIVQNWSMDYVSNTDNQTVTFLYTLTKKPAFRSYGVNVARLAGLSEDVISVAEEKSAELEQEIHSYRSLYLRKMAILNMLKEVNPQNLAKLQKLSI